MPAIAALLIALLVLGAAPPRVQVAALSFTLQRLAAVAGEPDDLVVDAGGRLVWGNLATGELQALMGGRVVTLARGLGAPEGIVVQPHGVFDVAEQRFDRVTRIDAGRRATIVQLAPVSGQDGLDGIGQDVRSGDLLIPDSPRGRVWRVGANGSGARVIARGLGRPVGAAVDEHGNVLVPDETLNALLSIAPGGAVTRLATLAVPDDVSVDRHGRIWVTTLGDGGLWYLDPGAAPRRLRVGLADPQGLALDTCGDPIVVQSRSGHIDRVLLTAAARRCAL